MSTYRVVRRPGHTWEGDAETPMLALVESGLVSTSIEVELKSGFDGIWTIFAPNADQRLGTIYRLSDDGRLAEVAS